MAGIRGLEVDRRVGIAMSVLAPTQTALIGRILQSHRAFAQFAAIPVRVRQLANSGQPLYLMRVSPSLRLIFRMVGDTAHVVDLVEQKTLTRFARLRAAERSPSTRVARRSPTVRKKKLGVVDE